MRRSKLDKIDRKILDTLQQEGRISNVNLAKEAGISAPPCLRRVRALEENNLITAYHAVLNPILMGYSVNVFALVTLDAQSGPDKEEFETYIQGVKEVRECYAIAGDIDYVMKVVAHDWDHYQVLLKEKLNIAPHAKMIKSCLAMSATKEEFGIPVDEA